MHGEKFHTAVLTLAGSGSTKERLTTAYVFSLGNIKTSEDIPADLREKFKNLCDTLTRITPTGQEGKVEVTVSQMDEIEILKVTEDIIGFYDTLCRRLALEDETH